MIAAVYSYYSYVPTAPPDPIYFGYPKTWKLLCHRVSIGLTLISTNLELAGLRLELARVASHCSFTVLERGKARTMKPVPKSLQAGTAI